MFGQKQIPGGGNSYLTTTFNAIATIGSIILVILFCGKIYRWSVLLVTSYIAGEYGGIWGDIATYAWFPIVALTLFFLIRAILALVINAVYVNIFARLFG